MDEKLYAIWLSDALLPGSIYVKPLIEKYRSFTKIYNLAENEYAEIGIRKGSQTMKKLLCKDTENAKKTLEFCNYNYFGVIEYNNESYPQRLKAIKNPPPVLYMRGRMINFNDNVCIGIVGTRSYTDAGWDSTYKIAGGIAKGGAIVVTGLASGIDTAATRAALKTSGFAVGVIGSGLETVYPSENTELFRTMYKSGLIISELPPFSKISGKYFPVRNRIISGLCQGVLVGEGNVKSGAMITASHATEQGRHVFAIPGDIGSEESSGVNKLIREGAIPVFEPSDVLSKYAFLYPHKITDTEVKNCKAVPTERSSKRTRAFSKTASETPVQEAEKSFKVVKSESSSERTHVFSKAELRVLAEVAEKMGKTNIDVAVNTCTQGKAEQATQNNHEKESYSFNDRENRVFLALSSDTAKNTDTLSLETGMTTDEVLGILTSLELSGFVSSIGGNYKKK